MPSRNRPGTIDWFLPRIIDRHVDMSKDRWHEIKEILDRALRRRAQERAAFVADACGGDADLRRELESLIAAYDEGHDDWEKSPVENAEALEPTRTRSGAADPEPNLSPGDTVGGKYRIERFLGRGGMGVVYRVRHVGLERPFALKLLRSFSNNPEIAEKRFKAEARLLGKLTHAHIVNVTDYGVDMPPRGAPYLVMEYLEGETLQRRMDSTQGLTLEVALPLLREIAEAVDHAHRQSILHLDLKPANVHLCAREDGRPAVKLLDFGLARLIAEPQPLAGDAGEERTADDPSGDDVLRTFHTLRPHREGSTGASNDGGFACTPAYVAPEVVLGQDATPASDIYSFGALIYAVLSGKPPFAGTVMEVITGHMERAPERLSRLVSSIPPEVDQSLLLPLQKKPADRPSCAEDVVDKIEQAYRQARGRRLSSRLFPWRVAIAAVLLLTALVLPSALSRWEPMRQLERWTRDLRFAAHPATVPDPRIVLITLDEKTLDADNTPLPALADHFGQMLDRVFSAGADRVAIDLLLPESWSRSPAFGRLVLQYSGRLTLGVYSTFEGRVVGPEAVRGLITTALGSEQANGLFGFVNLDEDTDGVVREGRFYFRDRDGQRRGSWAAMAAGSWAEHDPAAERFWIDYTADWRSLARISFKDLAQTLDDQPSIFDGALVLVGGMIAGSNDDHRVPRSAAATGSSLPGLIVQALQVNTILAGLPVREASPLRSLLGLGFALLLPILAALFAARGSVSLWLYSGSCILYIGVASWVFRESRTLIPVADPLIASVMVMATALLLRRRLANIPA